MNVEQISQSWHNIAPLLNLTMIKILAKRFGISTKTFLAE